MIGLFLVTNASVLTCTDAYVLNEIRRPAISLYQAAIATLTCRAAKSNSLSSSYCNPNLPSRIGKNRAAKGHCQAFKSNLNLGGGKGIAPSRGLNLYQLSAISAALRCRQEVVFCTIYTLYL